MRKLDLAKFSHLARCIEIVRPAAPHEGLCFHRSVALVLDVPTAVLVIGLMEPVTEEELEIEGTSAVPWLHAWVEIGDEVIAPTLVERVGYLYALPRHVYYTQNPMVGREEVSRSTIMKLARQEGWSAYFKRGVRKSPHPLGNVLLESTKIGKVAESVGFPPFSNDDLEKVARAS